MDAELVRRAVTAPAARAVDGLRVAQPHGATPSRRDARRRRRRGAAPPRPPGRCPGQRRARPPGTRPAAGRCRQPARAGAPARCPRRRASARRGAGLPGRWPAATGAGSSALRPRRPRDMRERVTPGASQRQLHRQRGQAPLTGGGLDVLVALAGLAQTFQQLLAVVDARHHRGWGAAGGGIGAAARGCPTSSCSLRRETPASRGTPAARPHHGRGCSRAAAQAAGPIASAPAVSAAPSPDQADVIVVGAGLAGLVATAELAGRRPPRDPRGPGARGLAGRSGVLVVWGPVSGRQPPAAPDGIRDSFELAWQDWLGTAGFDRPEDHWPRLWARAYVEFAAGEKHPWLHGQGVRFLPNPGLGGARRLPGHRARELGAALSMSPGEPGRAWWRRSSAGCARG